MSGVLIANKNETISISAPDVYGADFKISIYSQSSNEWVLSNAPMQEYIDNIVSVSEYITENVPKDATSIPVSDSSGFHIGEIIKIKNFFYRISKIENNIIYTHVSVYEDLERNEIIENAGNMSLYYIEVNLSEPGDYIIRAKDSLFGLDITDSLKVVPKSIEAMAKEIKNLEYAILGN
jgi:hypothetical protein